jgi:hypothetical protein
MMRHEVMGREKFVRKEKLWGDLGSVCVRGQGKSVGTTMIRNLKIQNWKRIRRGKREVRK